MQDSLDTPKTDVNRSNTDENQGTVIEHSSSQDIPNPENVFFGSTFMYKDLEPLNWLNQNIRQDQIDKQDFYSENRLLQNNEESNKYITSETDDARLEIKSNNNSMPTYLSGQHNSNQYGSYEYLTEPNNEVSEYSKKVRKSSPQSNKLKTPNNEIRSGYADLHMQKVELSEKSDRREKLPKSDKRKLDDKELRSVQSKPRFK